MATGKISRLPREIREQVNEKLDAGEPGNRLVAWLNELPAVQALLAAEFGGAPINEQNLTNWKQGGFRKWRMQHEVAAWGRINAEAQKSQSNAEGKETFNAQCRGGGTSAELQHSTLNVQGDGKFVEGQIHPVEGQPIVTVEQLVTIVAVRYLAVVREWQQAPMSTERRFRQMRVILRDVLKLQREGHREQRLDLDQQRLEFQKEQLEFSKERFEAGKQTDVRRVMTGFLVAGKQWPEVGEALATAFRMLQERKRGELEGKKAELDPIKVNQGEIFICRAGRSRTRTRTRTIRLDGARRSRRRQGYGGQDGGQGEFAGKMPALPVAVARLDVNEVKLEAIKDDQGDNFFPGWERMEAGNGRGEFAGGCAGGGLPLQLNSSALNKCSTSPPFALGLSGVKSWLKPHVMKTSLSTLSLCLAAAAPGHAAVPEPASAPASAAHPNIVYILTDDLGYGDVDSLNPLGKIKTPNINRLAAGGMNFTEAHSSSAVCTPSRYNILTGRYNWRSTMKKGVLGGFSKPLIEPGRTTVADLLRSKGYQTAYIGKWHLGLDWAKLPGAAEEMDAAEDDHSMTNAAPAAGANIDFTKPIGRTPITLGFDQFFGISASLDMPPYTFIENDHVVAQPTIKRGFMKGADGKHTRVGPQAPGFVAEDVLPTLTKHAVDYLDHTVSSAHDGKPFFLYLAFPTPHTPIAPTTEWLGKSGLNYYADYVMESDACVGQVLDALDRDGLTTNTLIVFASDNGCSPAADVVYLTSHGHDPSDGRRGYKADIFGGGHRIPMIVRWPARVAAGTQNHDFVCLGDFMATCAELMNVKLPDNTAEDSISYLPSLVKPGGPAPRQVLVESSINGSFGIREGEWKLAFCPDSGGWSYPRPGKDSTEGWPKFQLFDLAPDPKEQTNVLAGHSDVAQHLGHLMRQYILDGRTTPGAPQKNDTVKAWQQTAWLDEFK